jgi:hypothetical protein
MASFIRIKVTDSLRAAGELYHQLVLLVGENGTGKTAVLQELATDLGVSVNNLNLDLSVQMLELTARQRIQRLPSLFDQVVRSTQSLIIFDNIEILFDKGLAVDPLRLLQGVARNHLVLAAWNGRADGKTLVYAEPDHPEYRKYDAPDALIVSMNGWASIDPAVQR